MIFLIAVLFCIVERAALESTGAMKKDRRGADLPLQTGNPIERFFKIKKCRRVATRYDKLAGQLPGLHPARINTAVASCL
jgi:hypothetical protein